MDQMKAKNVWWFIRNSPQERLTGRAISLASKQLVEMPTRIKRRLKRAA